MSPSCGDLLRATAAALGLSAPPAHPLARPRCSYLAPLEGAFTMQRLAAANAQKPIPQAVGNGLRSGNAFTQKERDDKHHRTGGVPLKSCDRWPDVASPMCYVRVLMASDIKERIAPAIQAYYKFHDIRRVHFGLLHKKPTEAHRLSVRVTTEILRPQDSPPLNV